ncbi:MAG: hypothetical protein ACHQFZ_06965 [Acidimicrobiales bacterium]
MARSPHSLPGAHVLAWSSPLLLLVLLFTVSARTTPSPGPPTSPTESVTTTSTNRPPTTTVPRPTTTVPKPTTLPTTVTTARPFASATVSSAKLPARALNVSAASGALTGTLSPGFAVAVVPLHGPGEWTLGGSPTVTAVLVCPSVSGPVVGAVVINGPQSCQLELSSSDVAASPTWQLVPVR